MNKYDGKRPEQWITDFKADDGLLVEALGDWQYRHRSLLAMP